MHYDMVKLFVSTFLDEKLNLLLNLILFLLRTMMELYIGFIQMIFVQKRLLGLNLHSFLEPNGLSC